MAQALSGLCEQEVSFPISMHQNELKNESLTAIKYSGIRG
jgi:hypothetical protein